jgi:GntR family transcriptional regulator
VNAKPAWQLLADDLRRQITSGALAPGQKLPSERELEATRGVSRITIRHAMRVLASEGFVFAEQGRGLFVRDQPAMVRLARNRLSRDERTRTGGTFKADMLSIGLEPRVVTTIGLESADEDVALALDLADDQLVVTRNRRMYGGGDLMQLATGYYPADVARGTAIEREDTGHGGVYARLEEKGYTLVTPFVERVSARAPLQDERDEFGLPNGVPLLVVTRTARTTERVVEVNRILMRGDRYELVYEIAAD